MYEKSIHASFMGSGTKPGNGWMFHCPTVERDTAFAICAARRHKHWKGQLTQAHDCHCAMNAGKCPAVRMMQMEWREGEEFFFDAQVRKHALPKEIIEAIERIAVVPSHAAGLTLTDEQKTLLFGGLREIPSLKMEAEPVTRPTRAARKSKPSAGTSMTDALSAVEADMSEMINRSIEGDQE